MDSAKGGSEVELAVPGADRAPLSSPAGSVDQLLHQTAEEEEMEAKGLNTSGEMDFLILDEVKVDEEQEGSSELQEPVAKSAEIEEPVRTSTPKLDAEGSSKGDRECEKGLQLSVEDGDEDAASASSCGQDGTKKAGNRKAWGDKQEGDDTALMIQEEDEPEKSKVEAEPKKDVEELLEGAVIESPAQVADESAEAEKSLDSSDDVQVVAIEQPADKESTKKDLKVQELDSAKENKMPVLNGAANIGVALQASVMKDEDPDDPDPVDSNADDVDSKPPKRSASSHGILADLKRALSMIDAESGKPKRFKLDMDDGSGLKQEDGAHPPTASAAVVAASGESVGVPVGPSLVVLNRKQLEQYVSRRVRECLVTQATALLQPMEKKCDTLHRALERWRRRSFQLQKQLNEFVCEQEKCANARRSRRSVGVCVRMPPLKPQAPTPASPGIKTIPTTVMAPTSATSRAPSVTATRAPNVIVSTVASGSSTPARPQTPAQQIRVTGANASMLAAQLGLKPNQQMKLVSVSTPSGGSTAVVTRMPPQLQSAPSSSTSVSSSVPVPMQLIANTASMTGSSPAMKVGVPTSSAASPAGTSVRTVAVVSSASSGTSSASGVKIIDLTQEEEAANAHAKALSASGVSLGNALHKIVSSSSIPVLSAAPTSLVQVSSTSSPSTTRVSIAGTSVVLSHMTGGTVTQAGGNTLRLGSSPLVGPPARVTYLVPSLPPGMVVTPREAGPRLATGSGAQPMQTILLRMASPQGGFTTVPGGTIAVPANLMPANASGSPTGTPAGATTMMVATATGSQVRMVRAPPPMTLPRGGATLTLPPGTTLVRAPMASNMRPGVPQQMSVVRPPGPTASTPATPTTLSLPPKPTLQVQVPGAGASTPVRLPQPPLQVQVPISGGSVTGAVRPAKPDGNVSLIKTQHPASLPPTPRYIDDPKKKRLPPKPALKITKAASADNTTTIRKAPPAKKAVVVKKEVAELKPPSAEDMEKVLEQWQTFLDNQGENGGNKEDGKEQVRRRLPYHTQRPLRHACLCRLGTCRYDKLAATYKERLHADFGRLEPTQQLRELLGRMYTKGKAKRERNKRASKEDSSAAAVAARKGRCKWVYWLPASGAAQLRRKVCKAAFMAVHGITEKRTRDVQLLWMRLRAKRGHTPTGDESDIEREELMPGTYTDIDDEDEGDESAEKPVPKPACKPRRGRKILRASESEDSEAADDLVSVKRKSNVAWTPENGPKKTGSKVVVVKPPSLDSNVKTNEKSTRASQEEETEVEGDDEADDEDVPYLDISGFEPICALEEDSENLVLSLPRGLVLSWNMTFNTLYADIQTYQLYAYQETNSPPATSHWKKVGDVRALPLPMACTLTQFIEGHKYHFAVRAVDVHNRLGPFSDPSSILL